MLFLIIYGCVNHDAIRFLSITQFNAVDTLINKDKISYHKKENFIVEHYSENEMNEKAIDSVGMNPRDSNYKSIQDLQIVFYKSSSKTNLKNLKDNPRDIVRYSQDHDLIYIYYHSSGKFLFKQKWHNGEILDSTNKIEISIK